MMCAFFHGVRKCAGRIQWLKYSDKKGLGGFGAFFADYVWDLVWTCRYFVIAGKDEGFDGSLGKGLNLIAILWSVTWWWYICFLFIVLAVR